MTDSSPLLAPKLHYKDFEYINWFFTHKIKDLVSSQVLDADSILKLNFKRFYEAANSVPAYKSYLRALGVRPLSLKPTQANWDKIPQIDKKNYISKNNLSDMTLGGHISSHNKMLSLSSGSSGNPTFWPRGIYQEIEGAYFHEQLLTSHFALADHKTLVVVTFSMGSYLAGTYTYNSLRWVASKGYDMSIVTPGINKEDCLSMIKSLAPYYDQVILAGYPPFVKDLLELGVIKGIKWEDWHIKLLLASEYFSEKWRDGVAKIAGIKDVISDTTNIYGASEGTLFGWESKEAIFIKRAASQNKTLHRALFGSDLTPTLVEYNPALRYFEVIEGRLHLTAWAGVPLIRYDLKDYGGILSTEKRRKILRDFGIDISKHFKKSELTDYPMVYVEGRVDLSASIYGVLIFPEYIKKVVENEWDRLSGRLTIQTRSEEADNNTLLIHLELKEGKKKNLNFVKKLENSIKNELKKSSREYASLESAVGAKVWPKVILHSKNESDYFSKGIKQKWIAH
jgi:phenylacetate-CoA ligase